MNVGTKGTEDQIRVTRTGNRGSRGGARTKGESGLIERTDRTRGHMIDQWQYHA